MTLSADNRVSELVTAPQPSRRAARWPSFAGTPAGRFIGMTLLALLLAFLTVYPLSMLLYGSLHSTPPGAAGVFNLDGYRDIVTQRNLLVLLNTIGISLAKTVPSVIVAVFLAWILARTDTPFRGSLEVLVTLAVLHSADPDRDGLGHARQPAGRPAQPAVPMDHRLDGLADQRLFLWRRDLAHEPVFDAVPVPA